MPTANCNSGNGFTGVLSYIHQENKTLPEHLKHQVLDYNNVSGTVREIAFQMREVANERQTVKKPVQHLQINFHPDEKLDMEETLEVVDGILKEIGVQKDNHLYCAVVHKDKPHFHVHVGLCRIGLDGVLLNDHQILNKLQVACDKVEKQMNLRPTPNRTRYFDPTNEKGYGIIDYKKAAGSFKKVTEKNQRVKNEKEFIKSCVENAMIEAISLDELKEKLAISGVEIKYSTNSKGINGISYKSKYIAIKGSAIGYKFSEIRKKLQLNLERLNEVKIQNPLEELKPTSREQIEMDLVERFNKAITGVIIEYNKEFKDENINVSLEKIFEANGFAYDNGVYFIREEDLMIQAPLEYFKDLQRKALVEYDVYFEMRLAHEAMMKEEPIKISFWDSNKVKDEKIFANQELSFNQKSLKAPKFDFTPNLDVAKFLIKSSFDIKKEELERKIIFEKVKSKLITKKIIAEERGDSEIISKNFRLNF